MRPNHSLELQLVDVDVDDAVPGPLVESLHPDQSAFSQLAVEVIIADVRDGSAVAVVVVVGSLQPNQPGVLQVDVEEDVVVVGGVGTVDVVVIVWVFLSLHPNQPGVSHVVVVMVVKYVVVGPEVVLSSRQPHQPGVLHVSVLVLVVLEELLEVVVMSEPLLSKNFQL